MPINIEAGFLAKLIYTGDKKYLTEESISPRLFTGTYRNVFEFIQKYVVEHGEIPPMSVVKKYYPAVQFPEKSKLKRTKLKWWGQELRQKYKHNTLAEAIEKMIEQIERKDPDKALAIIKGTISDLEMVASKTRDIDFTKAAKLLKQEYRRVEKSKGLVGLPTLFPSLDRTLGGLDKEQLTVIIARTNVGKTWLLLAILYNIWKQGFTVALGTREMSEKQLLIRLASLHSGISHARIRLGLLTKEEKKRYFKALSELSKRKNPFIIFYVNGGIAYLRAKVEEIRPDILGVDGMYLMDDDENGSTEWERVTNISRGLKHLAQVCRIPIIGTTQANRATSKKTGPEVDNISYSDAVGQDADNVLGLNQTEEMKNDREMEVRVLKARDSGKCRMMITWDFENMEFKEVYAEMDQESGKFVEQKKDEKKKRKQRDVA